jgi:hypothetical protein
VDKNLLAAFSPSCRVARWYIFQTKNPILGKFWRVLQWKIYGHLIFLLPFGIFLWPFGIFFSRCGMLYQKKSGNPAELYLFALSFLYFLYFFAICARIPAGMDLIRMNKAF